MHSLGCWMSIMMMPYGDVVVAGVAVSEVVVPDWELVETALVLDVAAAAVVVVGVSKEIEELVVIAVEITVVEVIEVEVGIADEMVVGLG